MHKSVIVEKLPGEIFISDFSREIFEKEIDRKLRGTLVDKEKLFKKLYNVKSLLGFSKKSIKVKNNFNRRDI